MMGLIAMGGVLMPVEQLEAQVGLSSGVSQVALFARSAPRGSIQGVSGQRENGRDGAVRQLSVTVRMSANTGYQLRVQRSGNPTNRIWVRSADGRFQELASGVPVTVASDRHGAGQWERQVEYRVEVAEGSEPAGLPVRYEIAVDPTM
jgi:hypothetical protein